jgi:hypothetical protein
VVALAPPYSGLAIATVYQPTANPYFTPIAEYLFGCRKWKIYIDLGRRIAVSITKSLLYTWNG